LASDNKLFGINEEANILSLLHSAKEANAEVFLWRLIGDTKILAKVRIESIRKSRRDFCIVPIIDKDSEVNDLIAAQPHIDLYIPESALIMRCNVKQCEAPIRYYLSIPTFVAQVERRNNFRLDCHDEADIQVSFNKAATILRHTNQFFKKNCFDISSGGFSFLVSRAEWKFFKVNDQIINIDITLGKWGTKAMASVTMIREMDPDEFNGLSYKVWRICCKFTMLDDISKKYLDKYIFERIKDELSVINK